MAYSPVFPTTYQPIGYYPQTQASMPQNQQSNSGIIWVTGEAGAKSYLVAPNNTVQLWDSEQQTIYLKSADASGMPSMKILDYTIRSEVPQSRSMSFGMDAHNEISRKDLDALQSQIDALKDEVRAYRATLHEDVKGEA